MGTPSAVAKTSWGAAATISAALASAPDMAAPVEFKKGRGMMRQGRVHESMGSSRAGLSAETRARVAPIARGNPAPAGSQTEKPCAAESGPTLGGDRARDVYGRGSRTDGRRRA